MSGSLFDKWRYSDSICYSVSSPRIWSRIPCESRTIIMFYWSVPIILAIEQPFSNCDAFPDDKFRLSPLFTHTTINIGTNMGWTSVQKIAFCDSNLFFNMSKHMKRWETPFYKRILSIFPTLIVPAWLTNQTTG